MIRKLSRHMLERLVAESTEESFREAGEFWRIMKDVFPKKTAKGTILYA